MTQESHDTIGHASEIIDLFGGIRPMASKTGVPVTTIQGWKKRGVIPVNRVRDLRNAAMLHHIDTKGLLELPSATNNFHTDAESVTNSSDEYTSETPAVDKGPDNRSTARQSPPVSGYNINPQSNSSVLLVAGIIIFVAAAIGVVCAVAPEVKKLSVQEQRLHDLEAQVARMKLEPNKTRTVDNSAVVADINGLKSTVSDLTQQAKEYGTVIADLKNGNMTDRVQKIENHVTQMMAQANAMNLQNMVYKIQSMQSSAEGIARLDYVTSLLVKTNQPSKVNENIPTEGVESEANLLATVEELRRTDPKVAEAFKDIPPEDTKAALMLMGLTQLRHAMANDKTSFADDVALLRMAAKDDPALQEALDRLAPKAETGVLSPAGLSRELKIRSAEIVTASLTADDVTVKDKAVARMGQVVSIERDGKQISGTPTQQKLALAQKKFDAGDVEGAVAILNEIDGPAAAKTKPLIDEAQSTLLAYKLQNMISDHITQPMREAIGGGADYTTTGGGVIGAVKNAIPKELPRELPRELTLPKIGQ